MSTLMTASAEQRVTLRFANGARVYLYDFANGDQVATYQKADGSTRRFDSFDIRQLGYRMVLPRGARVSGGWSYEFPIAIEGRRHYTLEPLGTDELEPGVGAEANAGCEGAARLIDDASGAPVGLAVTEPLDARILQHAPSGLYQH